ncbi:MAG TPA: voltage-gated chloride channel [Clostridia bacterium]|jgi:H+/Cl- antiporter ClcA|nr:voltage-gated chloride channel [Clostridia bacterium]
MKKTAMEEAVLFVSIIKWTLLSTITGLVVGCGAAIFLKALDWSIGLVQVKQYYFLFLPVALFVSSFLVKYLASDAEGHGTEKVIEAIHKRWGKIDILVAPVKLVTAIITLAFGGSAGKEGPCVQIGAGLSSSLADLFKVNKEDRRKIVVCGVSAGFSAVFGTPIAGALFAVEVLVLGKIMHEMLFPALVSAIISFQVTKYWGITYFYKELHIFGGFQEVFFLKVLVSGLFFGIVAFILVETLKMAEGLAKRLKIWAPFKGLLGGTILVLLALATSTDYLGLGTETIEEAIHGAEIFPAAFLLKILFTSITLSMGGSGGILTPILFIGSTAGSAFAGFFNLNPEIFAAIGMVALFSGANNTPITASVMAIEIFGAQIGVYAATACVVSYVASGHRSVYPSQLLGMTKSPSISLPLMEDLSNLGEVKIQTKPGKLIFRAKKVSEYIERKYKAKRQKKIEKDKQIHH